MALRSLIRSSGSMVRARGVALCRIKQFLQRRSQIESKVSWLWRTMSVLQTIFERRQSVFCQKCLMIGINSCLAVSIGGNSASQFKLNLEFTDVMTVSARIVMQSGESLCVNSWSDCAVWLYNGMAHCDWIMGRDPEMQAAHKVYAPELFIVGQERCQADRYGSMMPRKFWNPPGKNLLVVNLKASLKTALELRRRGFFMGYSHAQANGLDHGFASCISGDSA